jgi:hypothetical protein
MPVPRLTLEGLPGEAAAPTGGPASGSTPATRPVAASTSPASSPDASKDRSFLRAAGEVVLIELIPWSYSRFVAKSDFAYISIDSVRENLETGFTYDRDAFITDQSSHPFHGSLFYNSARSNGYSFWESGAFAFFGSFAWEVGMETEPPAFNDLVNTTLGGMARGEIGHRLSMLLRDNMAVGSSRFWRELGGAVLNPVGAFNRLLDGELNRTFTNPPDRFPSRFVATLDGLYQRRSGSGSEGEDSDQGGLSVGIRYGDPFDGGRHQPYEFFELTTEITMPGSPSISRITSRGILADRELAEGGATRQRLAAFLHFNYYDNAPTAYGSQELSLDHLLLGKVGPQTELRTEAGVSVMPVVGLEVDYEELSVPVFGRSFAYGPGAGVHASARLRRREIDLVTLSWNLIWHSTLDGLGNHSRLHSISAEGRLPFHRDRFSVGASWSWAERLTTYDAFPTVLKSGTTVRLFGAVNFR